MGFFSDLLDGVREDAAVDYTFHVLGEPAPETAIIADQHYLRVWLRSARIVNVREWSSKFHATVHARFSFLDNASGMREAITTIAPASQFQDLDPEHLDRFIVINRPLLGPIPYRGQINMQIGLFSVKAVDLAKPYIDLLLNLSEASGVSMLSALRPFVEPMRRGAETLFANKDYARLEIGIDRTDSAVFAGNIVVARVPKHEVDFATLRIDPNDWRLIRADGEPITAFPYMVLGIERITERSDYITIPEIRGGWETIRAFSQEGRPAAEIEERFAQLKRLIWLSPDLLAGDKKRILGIFRENLKEAGFDGVASLATELEAFDEFAPLELAPAAGDAVPLKPIERLLGDAATMPVLQPERISLAEFQRRMADPRVPEASLKPYIIADRERSKPYAPAFLPNPALVDIPLDLTEEQGTALMAAGNETMRLRRHSAFQIRQLFGDARPILVSEGDSWFQFPVFLADVIDQLNDDFSIWSLDAAGDTLKMISQSGEYLTALRHFRSSARAFLFSAGGNDIIGEDEFTIDGELKQVPVITQILLPFAPNRQAADYINNPRFQDRLSFIETETAKIFTKVSSEFPALPIICHGYDHAIPATPTDPRGPHLWCAVDEWLGGPFRKDLGIHDPDLQREIIKLMINELNAAQKRLCGGNNPGGLFKNAWHVDVRGKVGNNRWEDEVHPTDDGFRAVAGLFRSVIRDALASV